MLLLKLLIARDSELAFTKPTSHRRFRGLRIIRLTSTLPPAMRHIVVAQTVSQVAITLPRRETTSCRFSAIAENLAHLQCSTCQRHAGSAVHIPSLQSTSGMHTVVVMLCITAGEISRYLISSSPIWQMHVPSAMAFASAITVACTVLTVSRKSASLTSV